MGKLTVIKREGLAKSNPRVVNRLNEAVEMVEMGGIECCAIVMITDQGEVVDCWANGSNPFAMVGALESLKRDYMDAYIEVRD